MGLNPASSHGPCLMALRCFLLFVCLGVVSVGRGAGGGLLIQGGV